MANPTETVRQSWNLLKCSFQIIFQNKRLLLFPVLSMVFVLGLVFLIAVPVAFQPTGQPWTSSQHWHEVGQRVAAWAGWEEKNSEVSVNLHVSMGGTSIYLAAAYLLTMFAATFWNVAFYNEILKALAGEEVSVLAGLKFALGRLRPILAWSLFAGLVGLAIQALESRSSLLGRLALRFIGLAWSVAAVFVIPVIVREDTANPLELLKNSTLTLKKTWGEMLVGYVGIGFASLCGSAAVFGCIMLLLAGVVVSVWMGTVVLMALSIGAVIAALLLLSYVVSTASHVYRCALYVYATEGVPPAPYTTELMDAAWKVKKA